MMILIVRLPICSAGCITTSNAKTGTTKDIKLSALRQIIPDPSVMIPSLVCEKGRASSDGMLSTSSSNAVRADSISSCVLLPFHRICPISYGGGFLYMIQVAPPSFATRLWGLISWSSFRDPVYQTLTQVTASHFSEQHPYRRTPFK